MTRKNNIHKQRVLLSFGFVFLLFATRGDAGDVRSGISSRETYVGIPVTIQIQFSNVSEHEPPQLPEVDGLEMESVGTPSRSSRITIINGRRSEELSITYAFEVTPQREGEFVIPGIAVSYDNRRELIRGFRLVAKKSETGDLMGVSIEGKKSSVFVGESLDLQLNILIRPYRDEANRITLSEGQMWQLLSERTEWGIFSERMEELTQNNQRPVGREVTRDDDDGKPQRYYLYSIDATIYPQRPGTIDADGCRIMWNYPTGIGRRRSPLAEMFGDDPLPRSRFFDDAFSDFGARLTVTSARPLVAEASVEPIDVKPIPEAGRPDDYRGAVGRYRLVAQAKPTTAKVGDPITLHLVIAGDGPMDRVQAPPLAEIPALTADFQVANQPLAGLVEGNTKLFSTTIRPRSVDVQEIPSIPLSFFDPEQEQFVTVSSEPIPVTVEAAETMSLDKIVGNDRPQPSESPNQTLGEEPAGSAPVDELDPADRLLASQQPARLVRSLDVWFLALPPMAVLICFVVARREQFAGWFAGLSSADQRFRKQLGRADSPSDIRDALLDWIARKTRSRPTSESAAVGALRLAGYRGTAAGCENLFGRCHRAATGVISDDAIKTDRLKADAEHLIPQWNREAGGSLRAQRWASAKRARRTVSTGIFLLSITGSSIAGPAEAAENFHQELDVEQRRLLLEEAVELHGQALANRAEKPIDAREQAEQAAARYQTVIETGSVNPALFFNKAGAEYHAGHLGLAIADYRRALKLHPDDDRVLDALRQVESSLGVADEDLRFDRLTPSAVSRWAVWLTRWIPAAVLRSLAIATWVIVWLMVGLRIYRRDVPWKTVSSAALLIAVLAGAAYVMHRYHWTRDGVAIVVQPGLTLRSGDDESYAVVSERDDSEGMAVELITARNGWAKIQIDETTSGWVPASSLSVI